jgi:hypothetical protein
MAERSSAWRGIQALKAEEAGLLGNLRRYTAATPQRVETKRA